MDLFQRRATGGREIGFGEGRGGRHQHQTDDGKKVKRVHSGSCLAKDGSHDIVRLVERARAMPQNGGRVWASSGLEKGGPSESMLLAYKWVA